MLHRKTKGNNEAILGSFPGQNARAGRGMLAWPQGSLVAQSWVKPWFEAQLRPPRVPAEGHPREGQSLFSMSMDTSASVLKDTPVSLKARQRAASG